MKIKISPQVDALLYDYGLKTGGSDYLLSEPDFSKIHEYVHTHVGNEYIPAICRDEFDPSILYGTNGTRETTFTKGEIKDLIALAMYTALLKEKFEKLDDMYDHITILRFYEEEHYEKIRVFCKALMVTAIIEGIPSYKTEEFIFGYILAITPSLKFVNANASCVNKIRNTVTRLCLPPRVSTVTGITSAIEVGHNLSSVMMLRYYMEHRYDLNLDGISARVDDTIIMVLAAVLIEEIDVTVATDTITLKRLKALAIERLSDYKHLCNLLRTDFGPIPYSFDDGLESSPIPGTIYPILDVSNARIEYDLLTSKMFNTF